MKVFQIIKALYPVADKIILGIEAAKRPESKGGSKITQEEKRKIIFDAVVDVIPAIEEEVKNL